MGKFRLKYQILILAGLFVILSAVFFITRQSKTAVHDEVYSSALEESRLPVVWVKSAGREMDRMRGHLSSVSYDETDSTLAVLPESRVLELTAKECGSYILSAEYELRNEKLTDLIEEGEVEDFEKNDRRAGMKIQFQNILQKDREYRLDLVLNTADGKAVHYYTRVMISDNAELADEMVETALKFSESNFNYDTAKKENTKYMETDGSADDSTLSYINLKSTFNNLAYGGLRLTRVGEEDIRFVNYDGNSGEVHYAFMAVRDVAGSTPEYFEIEETYVMRMGLTRIYLMNYSRKIREVYMGGNSSGKRIILGINDADDMGYIADADENHVYFVSTNDLWGFNSGSGSVKSILSFRSNDSVDSVSYSRDHNIELLRCDENGDLHFLLYGYMSRGIHEGKSGIAYMKYSVEEDTVSEVFFIPVERSYESIREDMEELSYLGDANVLYLKIGSNFYSVDITSDSYIVIATGIRDKTYCVSKTGEKLAWQDDDNEFGSETIHIIDMDTGIKKEIRSQDGILLKPEGFIGRDFVVSTRNTANAWFINGKIKEIPASTVEIVDDDLNVLKKYEKNGSFISDIKVHDGRVNMTLMKKTAMGNFTVSAEDTIVSSTETPGRREGIGFYNSDDKLRVYYVTLGEDVRQSRLTDAAVTKFTDDVTEISGITAGEDSCYYAYADGSLLGIYTKVSDAIETAYPNMGYVRSEGHMIYNRSGTLTSRFAENYDSAAEELILKRENGLLFDLSGISLREALYYVGLGYPVVAYDGNGRPGIIYYYNKDQISVYYPDTDERYYPAMDKASDTYDSAHRDFSCNFTLD